MNSDIPMAKIYYDDFMPYIRVQHNKKVYLDIYEIEKQVKMYAKGQKILEDIHTKYSNSNNNSQ